MESLYENLSVYKKALELTVYFEMLIRHFEKYHKYTIGSDLRNASRRITVLVAKANIRASRKLYLIEALDKLDELKILIHIANESGAFRKLSNSEFASKSVVEISKQCEGWLSTCQNSS